MIGVDVPLAVELDRSSPVPLYYQLAQAIEAAIRDGELAPGDRFENELALAKRLTLSRPTTRRAIQELVDKGLLVRKRGVGTQVVQNPVHRRVELTSLFDDLARAGQEPTTQLLEYHTGPAGEEIAAELNLSAERDVVTIQRLRCANGEPLAVMTNYLPVELAPDPEELESAGLYQSLRTRGIHIRLARQRIGAKPATRAEARLLDEKVGGPLLTMSRTAFDDSGKAVEFGAHCYRASRYYFETTLVDR
jgi:DNA-binding GntR family transcriptional regulator